MHYFGLVGEGPFKEVLVKRELYTDGRPGTRLVSQEPTGVLFGSFREGERVIAQKNAAIARERYGR